MAELSHVRAVGPLLFLGGKADLPSVSDFLDFLDFLDFFRLPISGKGSSLRQLHYMDFHRRGQNAFSSLNEPP